MALAVPEASYASALGIAHGIHYGAGFGTGKLVGGYMIASIGSKLTFCAMGGFIWLVLLMFIVVQMVGVSKYTFHFDEL